MKAISVLALLGLLLGIVLSGCTPAPLPEQAAPTEQMVTSEGGEATEAPAPAAETKKIVFWHLSDQGTEMIQGFVDRYMADNPDVQVEVVPIQNDPYKTKLSVAMGAGSEPCIFSTWSGGPMHEYIDAGKVLDLTDYMNEGNYKDRFLDGAIQMATYQDKIWAVPIDNISIAVVFYNKGVFEENGIAIPTTYDELLAAADTLKAAGVAPFALANKTKWPGSMYFMYLVDRLGGPEVFESAAGRTGGSFEDPVFIQAGKMLQDLVERGAFVDGFNGLDYDTGQSRLLLYSDKAAMELMGTWDIGTVKAENPEYYESQLGFFPFPSIEGGKGDPANLVGSLGDNFYSISSSCKYPDEAFELLQYLIDDQAVAERVASGRMPPVKGLAIEDPVLLQVKDIFEAAPNVQLWYDQYLPPDMGELHKDTTQALLGLTMTPEEAAAAMEAAAVEQFGK
jgi:raffinose/stachyose/melibiose transport system substrate-binding protein